MYTHTHVFNLKLCTCTRIDFPPFLDCYCVCPPVQISGHHIAKLDPLGIGEADLNFGVPFELQPEKIGKHDKQSLILCCF